MKIMLVVLCLILVGCERSNIVPASDLPISTYQIVSDSNGNAWRVNTITGEVKRCWQGSPGVTAYPPTCYTAAQK